MALDTITDEDLRNKVNSDDSIKLTEEQIRIVSKWFQPFNEYTIGSIDKCELVDHRNFAFQSPYFSQLINLFGTEDKRGVFNYKYAWISPVGQYYSCGYSGHEIKSQMILRANEYLMLLYLKLFNDVNQALLSLENLTGENNPSDFLLKKGWCRLQSADNSDPVANTHELVRLTKKQRDTIFFATLKYKFSKDPVTGEYIHWNKVNSIF